MTVDQAIREWIRADASVPGEDRAAVVVVGVSGGADSTALGHAVCDALRRSHDRRAAVLAHFAHGIRPRTEESRDLEAVRLLAAASGAPVIHGVADPLAGGFGSAGGREAAARRMRYGFLRRVCRLTGSRTILTAHTADDQIETVLMRLLDGQQGARLAGIPRRRPAGEVRVERPLLEVPRSEVVAYLRRNRLPWSEDSTNRDQTYRRNRLRKAVLPALRREWPAVDHDLLELSRGSARLQAQASAAADAVPVAFRGREVRIGRAAFFAAREDARLEVLYRATERAGLTVRRDRPSHRFFAPVLGPDPGESRRLIGGRGLEILLRRDVLLIRPEVVRESQDRYLGEATPGVSRS